MFTLRRIPRKGELIEHNVFLGNEYFLIERCYSPQIFEETYKLLFNKECDVNSHIYAFIRNYSGEEIPLYEDYYYYIVTESGKTYANISRKLLKEC